MESTEEVKLRNLRRFNAVMAAVHFLQGILILVLSNNVTLPIKTYYLNFDTVTQSLVPTAQTLYDLPIAPMIALFFFICATDHFLLAGPLRKWYEENLRNHINKARWYEYALSASVMIVVVAMLVGIYEVVALMGVFALTAVMNLFGLTMEQYNQKSEKVNWTSFIFGSFAGIVPWIGIAIYLAGAGSSSGGSVPDFVYWIFVSIGVFFFSFAINMVLQYKRVGKWKDYLYGEKVYIILSLVAKSLLAWQVFAGTLRPL
ncbi:MAG: heliorhodopsin HeR [Methanomassiliicoccus sp.]|nr:heliorhodopsin HeR [Methanomassiliicoccus sp.]